MGEDYKNIAVMLLILALFMGATIEISEGSTYVGVILFVIAAILIMHIRLTESTVLKNSTLYLLVGFFIVLADIIYNFSTNSQLGTLDSMTFFLGMSLVAFGIKNPQIRRVGEIGTYITSVFIVLFLIFYIIFGALNIDFLHKFDHYLILLPTVGILNLAGIPLEVIAMETVKISGVEEMTLVIGGPCSGLYSMFLLIGIVFGYSRIENLNTNKTLMMLGFCVLVAYISNLFRVVVLYFTAYMYGHETMMVVHTHLGWIIFAVVAAFIMYLIEPKS